VLCHDGVTRDIVFDLLFITADHQEAQTHMGVAGSAQAAFPCVTCECPLSVYGRLQDVGTHRSYPARGRDAHWELQREMTATLESEVERKRERGVEITDSLRAKLAIGVEKRLGRPLSRRMGTLAAWEGFWCVQQGGDEELFKLVSADCLHTVEEGLTLHLRSAHQKFLQDTYPERWLALAEELDACLLEVGKQQRWPGWRLPAGHKRFFAGDERFTATELASIRMVSMYSNFTWRERGSLRCIVVRVRGREGRGGEGTARHHVKGKNSGKRWGIMVRVAANSTFSHSSHFIAFQCPLEWWKKQRCHGQ
jgi:hypothetical protein